MEATLFLYSKEKTPYLNQKIEIFVDDPQTFRIAIFDDDRSKVVIFFLDGRKEEILAIGNLIAQVMHVEPTIFNEIKSVPTLNDSTSIKVESE